MNAVIAPFESDVVGADEMEESHSFYDDEAVSWWVLIDFRYALILSSNNPVTLKSGGAFSLVYLL